MKDSGITLFTFLLVLFFQNSSFSQNTENLIKKIQNQINSIKYFKYETVYTSVNPSLEDSVYICSGKIWGEKVPTDTLFGCYFHVKGEDVDGKFDYYYDGSNSFEIRHATKEVSIFNPSAYPNDNHNPAKARTALLPFIELLIDNNFYKTVYKNNPEVKLKVNPQNSIVVFKYPPNEYNQELTEKYYVNPNKNIEQIVKIVNWNKIVYTTTIDIKNYQTNNVRIKKDILLNKTYDTYVTKKNEIKNKINQKSKFNLIGKQAPHFHFKSYTGEEISLSNYRGKLVLLDFWETWCGHCILTMPKLNKLSGEYKDKDLKIIGVTTENREQIRKLIQKNNLHYTNIYADKSILNNYNVSNRPTYVLINKSGKIILVTYGELDIIISKIEENL